MNKTIYNVSNKGAIEKRVRILKNRGLKENVDFRIVYFSNTAEVKLINRNNRNKR